MAQEEITNGNKLIAEFMDVKFDTKKSKHKGGEWYLFSEKNAPPRCLYSMTLSSMQYHKSWDWLMPTWRKVVDVIAIWAVSHSDKNKLIGWEQRMKSISHALSTVDIDRAFSEIRETITWHNQNQSK